MSDKRDQWADTFSTEPGAGWLSGFLADEDALDRRTLWRLGSWGVGAVAAVIVAILAGQSSVQLRREQDASADMLARQSQQIQSVAKETQTEAKRLSQAIDTLNSDRDRLYARVTSVEQGLDSVTGSIKRQVAVAAPANLAPVQTALPAQVPAAAPATSEVVPIPTAKPSLPAITSIPVSPVVTAEPAPAKPVVPASAPVIAPLMASKSIMAPPDVAATRLIEPPAPAPITATPDITASIPPAAAEPAAAEAVAIPVQRTEFGIDIGGANSVDGLRALWRGTAKAYKALDGLRPIIMVKERNTGLGMQLRLVAGPIGDAAAAAKLCAALIASNRSCETSVFDGQRLALGNNVPPTVTPAALAPPSPRKRSSRISRTELAPPKPIEEAPPPPPPAPQSSLSSFLGSR